MNLFKKNKGIEDAESSVSSVTMSAVPEKPKELSDFDKLIDQYKFVNEFISANDVANMSDVILKVEFFRLMFAMYAELKQINKTLSEIKQ